MDNGDFGWVDVYGNIFRPEHLLEIDNGQPNIRSPYDSPYYSEACNSNDPANPIDCTKSNWFAVGVDEYDPTSGLSEAEIVCDP